MTCCHTISILLGQKSLLLMDVEFVFGDSLLRSENSIHVHFLDMAKKSKIGTQNRTRTLRRN